MVGGWKGRGEETAVPCQGDCSREKSYGTGLWRSSAGIGSLLCIPGSAAMRRGDSAFSAYAVKVFRMISVGRLWEEEGVKCHLPSLNQTCLIEMH